MKKKILVLIILLFIILWCIYYAYRMSVNHIPNDLKGSFDLVQEFEDHTLVWDVHFYDTYFISSFYKLKYRGGSYTYDKYTKTLILILTGESEFLTVVKYRKISSKSIEFKPIEHYTLKEDGTRVNKLIINKPLKNIKLIKR